MTPLLLKTSEAAKLCGVSVKLWRTWNALGQNPAPLRVGRSLYWNQSELTRWVDAGCPPRLKWNTQKKDGATDSQPRKKE